MTIQSDCPVSNLIGQSLGDSTLQRRPPQHNNLQPASVLLGIIDSEDGLSILLTTRTAHLHHHPGQVSLPGGRTDPGDRNSIETALRETEEEIGLHPEFIDIIGVFDHYPTDSGFLISPVVARISEGYTLTADNFEVAEIFHLPLAVLFDTAQHQRHEYHDKGRKGYYHQIDYEGKRIWGVTAGILMCFYEKLRSGKHFCEILPLIKNQ